MKTFKVFSIFKEVFSVMTNDDLFAKPPRRRAPAPLPPAPPRSTCVVCNLRADCLVCKECAGRAESSIKWLERLPTSERVTKALEVLRSL